MSQIILLCIPNNTIICPFSVLSVCTNWVQRWLDGFHWHWIKLWHNEKYKGSVIGWDWDSPGETLHCWWV